MILVNNRSLLICTSMLLVTAIHAQHKPARSIQWDAAGKLPAAKTGEEVLGLAGPVAGLHNNVLMVGGGANFPGAMPWLGGKKKYYDSLYVYQKGKSNQLLLVCTFKLPEPNAYAANCSTSKGLVFAGGENENGISKKVYLLLWNARRKRVDTKTLPELPVALTNASATSYDHVVYVAGGETPTAASDQLFSLDLVNPSATWKKLPPLPRAVSHAVFVAQKHRDHTSLYLAGGRKKNPNGISDLYSSLYSFDIIGQQWSEKKSLPYSLCAGTGIAHGSSAILMFGGDKGETFHEVETLVAAISRENDENKKQELILLKNKLQSGHPGFSKEILQYNTLTDDWTVVDSIPFQTPVTTTAVRWGKEVIIPSGEVRAGVRNPFLWRGRVD